VIAAIHLTLGQVAAALALVVLVVISATGLVVGVGLP